MTTFSTPLIPSSVVHDPDGPEVQVHEVGDEVFMTFSEEFLQKTDWREGDQIIWDISSGEVTLTNPKADMRKELHQRVDELLDGGTEL